MHQEEVRPSGLRTTDVYVISEKSFCLAASLTACVTVAEYCLSLNMGKACDL